MASPTLFSRTDPGPRLVSPPPKLPSISGNHNQMRNRSRNRRPARNAGNSTHRNAARRNYGELVSRGPWRAFGAGILEVRASPMPQRPTARNHNRQGGFVT